MTFRVSPPFFDAFRWFPGTTRGISRCSPIREPRRPSWIGLVGFDQSTRSHLYGFCFRLYVCVLVESWHMFRSDLLRLCSGANTSLTMVVTPGCFTHYSLVCCCKREFRVITWMMDPSNTVSGSHPFSNFVPRAANLNHESYLGSRTFTAFISLLLPIHAEVAGVHAAPRGDRLNVSSIPLAFDPRSQGHGNLLFTRCREIYWPLVHVIQYTLDHPRYQKGVCVRDSAGARKHDRCRRIRRDS